MKLSLFLFPLLITALQAKIKVACVGDSITFGTGVKNRLQLCYPAQLAKLLGNSYQVENFGISARTMLTKGDYPYTKEKVYQKSLEFSPNIVLIKLGTNDSKPKNWVFKADYIADTMAIVKSYRALPSAPRVILCKPIPVVRTKWGINEKIVRGEIARQLEQVAYDNDVELIDLHPILIDQPQQLPDGIHPNIQGATIMASHIHRYLTTPRETNPKIKIDGKASNFYGFACHSFKHQGLSMKIAIPKKEAEGRPWIWRARFWGHQPQFDVTMLELGWHIVYCDVSGLFGAPKAMERWDKAYNYTQQLGLHPKPVLEGMSRGGLPIHHWAATYPQKTAGIIGDNCVMDFKSWPAGWGRGKGSAKTWLQCKKAYGFKTDEEAKAYASNSVDTIDQIAKQSIPILYLVADNDKVVPHDENSAKAAAKVKDYNKLKVINKPGLAHHPHSLPNPAPIVEFALECHR